MNTIRRTISILTLTAALTGFCIEARAGGNTTPETPVTDAAAGILSVTLSPLAPFFLTSITHDLNHGHKKQLLAQQALDDAAVFYQTGELTGILPAVLKTFRAADSENEKLTNVEIVDAMTAEAERILNLN